ncbi:TRAP transporter substrate-binding protein DctP [Marasmitruncus massiliensis]|uniref:TRAP transporter substrate-binding protein DctP n=1 Tax=Marasmitruncus massiliensis TaxID=1944642 RepID=UPI000C7E85A6|nr:TRAP transporter substrate-binding protein DctP [Marasmitruncus massiliensis]
MKKFLALILAFTMTIGMAACSEKNLASEASNSVAQSGETQTESKPAAQASEPVVLKISIAETSADVKAEVLDEFVKKVEERTNGTIKFEVYYSNELGSLSDVTEQMAMGGNVLAGTSGDFYADYGCPDIMSTALQYALPSVDAVMKVNDSELFAEWCAKIEESSGLKILCCNWAAAPRSVLSTKPINSAADFKALKIRVPGAAASAFFEALGAAPQTGMPFSEIYTNMQQGVVEACEAPLSTLSSYSLQEVAKNCYLSEHSLAPSCWAMSAKIFNSLSVENQKILQEEMVNYGYEFMQKGLDSQAEFKKTMEDAGVVFIEPSKDDIKLLQTAGKASFEKFPEMTSGLYDQLQEIID